MKFTYATSREKDPDFKSRTIMKAIGFDYSHSLIMVDDSMIFHATGKHEYRDGRKVKGFHMIEGDNMAEFLETHDLGHLVDLPVINPDYAFGYCQGNVGKDYSESQLIGCSLPILRVFMGDDTAELICSEFPIRFAMHKQILDFKFAQEPDWICPKVCTEVMYKIAGKVMP